MSWLRCICMCVYLSIQLFFKIELFRLPISWISFRLNFCQYFHCVYFLIKWHKIVHLLMCLFTSFILFLDPSCQRLSLLIVFINIQLLAFKKSFWLYLWFLVSFFFIVFFLLLSMDLSHCVFLTSLARCLSHQLLPTLTF